MQLTFQQSDTELSPIDDEVVSVAYTNARNRVIGGGDDRAKLEWLQARPYDQSYEQLLGETVSEMLSTWLQPSALTPSSPVLHVALAAT
jgi:hypothetical protein